MARRFAALALCALSIAVPASAQPSFSVGFGQ